MLEEMSPAEFAMATMTAAKTTRLDSLGVLFEYQVATRTDGANAYVKDEQVSQCRANCEPPCTTGRKQSTRYVCVQ